MKGTVNAIVATGQNQTPPTVLETVMTAVKPALVPLNMTVIPAQLEQVSRHQHQMLVSVAPVTLPALAVQAQRTTNVPHAQETQSYIQDIVYVAKDTIFLRISNA